MSTTQLTIASVVLSFASISTIQAEYPPGGSGSAPSYTIPPLASPVDGDFIGWHLDPVYFSGAIGSPKKTVYVQVLNADGNWFTIASAKSSPTSSNGRYYWHVSEAVPYDAWDRYFHFGQSINYADVRAITYSGRTRYVLGEATITSYGNGS